MLASVARAAFPRPALFLLYACLVLGGMVAVWNLATPQYRSNASITVDHGVAGRDRSQVVDTEAEAASRAQVALLKSSAVVESAIAQVGVSRLFPAIALDANASLKSAVLKAQDNLSVRLVPLTRTLSLSFKHEDPAVATAFLDALLRSYRQRFEVAYEGSEIAAFLQHRLSEAEGALALADADLAKLKADTLVFSFEQQQGLLLERRSESATRLMRTTDQLASVKAKIETVPRQLSILMPSTSRSSKSVLGQNYQDGDRVARMSQAPMAIISGVYEETLTNFVKLKAQAQGLDALQTQQRAALADIDRELAQLQAQQAQYDRLQTVRDQAEDNFRAIKAKLTQADLNNAKREAGLANVKTVQPPTSSSAPVWPSLPTLLGFGAMLMALPVSLNLLRAVSEYQRRHPNGFGLGSEAEVAAVGTDCTARARPAHLAWATFATKGFAIVLAFSCAVAFNTNVIPSFVQQALAIICWFGIMYLSLILPRVARFAATPAMFALVLFYGYAVLSAVWSSELALSLTKATVLFITTFGAYRLACVLTLEEIVECFVVGLSAALVLSLLLVIAVPSVGVTHGWMHEGLWRGVYGSKQGLGMIGALLLVLSGYLIISRPVTVWSVSALLLAALCVYGSGSRGGGAMAVAAIVAIMVCRRSVTLSWFATWAPIALLTAALAASLYLCYTGEDFFLIFGREINLTERTAIWQHALSFWWNNALLLGSGLNGFWPREFVQALFFDAHGWVLDDYHSGYNAILGDTGLLGYALFAVTCFLVGARLRWLLLNDREHFRQHVLVTCLLGVLFLISLTETIFLRSTSAINSLIFILFLASLRRTGVPRG